MWKWFIPLAAGIAIAVGVAAIGAQQSSSVHVGSTTRSGTTGTSTGTGPVGLKSTCGSLTGPPTTYDHVIWIWMSDESYTDEIGARGALYTNQLANQCGLATNYAAITHPDVPNEVAALSGGTQGLTRQGCAPCTTAAASLLSQVGGSWKVYVQGMRTPCQRTASGFYLPLSNPATFFTSSNCAAHDVPMGTPGGKGLATDLASGKLPRFSILVPDVCDSGSGLVHRYPRCGQSKRVFEVARSDSWLQHWIGTIEKSPAYQSGKTVVIVTWDQGSAPSKKSQLPQVGLNCLSEKKLAGGCWVATMVVSPYVHPHTWVKTRFSHYSLLRTTEELLGIHVYLGAAHNAQSMRQAFGL